MLPPGGGTTVDYGLHETTAVAPPFTFSPFITPPHAISDYSGSSSISAAPPPPPHQLMMGDDGGSVGGSGYEPTSLKAHQSADAVLPPAPHGLLYSPADGSYDLHHSVLPRDDLGQPLSRLVDALGTTADARSLYGSGGGPVDNGHNAAVALFGGNAAAAAAVRPGNDSVLGMKCGMGRPLYRQQQLASASSANSGPPPEDLRDITGDLRVRSTAAAAAAAASSQYYSTSADTPPLGDMATTLGLCGNLSNSAAAVATTATSLRPPRRSSPVVVPGAPANGPAGATTTTSLGLTSASSPSSSVSSVASGAQHTTLYGSSHTAAAVAAPTTEPATGGSMIGKGNTRGGGGSTGGGGSNPTATSIAHRRTKKASSRHNHHHPHHHNAEPVDIASPSDFESKSEIVAYVEQKLEGMEESFTFKSATYQTHLKRFLPRPDEKQRKYIERIDSFPRIPTSAAEERELMNLRQVKSGMCPDSRLGDGDGLTIKERLDEMLTSLVNKIMFLLVVKFDTWYIHAPAREQIREQLLEFIWPSLPELHSFFREHFTSFIDMRIRHFRDSVARYFRDRPRPEPQTTPNGSVQQHHHNQQQQSGGGGGMRSPESVEDRQSGTRRPNAGGYDGSFHPGATTTATTDHASRIPAFARSYSPASPTPERGSPLGSVYGSPSAPAGGVQPPPTCVRPISSSGPVTLLYPNDTRTSQRRHCDQNPSSSPDGGPDAKRHHIDTTAAYHSHRRGGDTCFLGGDQPEFFHASSSCSSVPPSDTSSPPPSFYDSPDGRVDDLLFAGYCHRGEQQDVTAAAETVENGNQSRDMSPSLWQQHTPPAVSASSSPLSSGIHHQQHQPGTTTGCCHMECRGCTSAPAELATLLGQLPRLTHRSVTPAGSRHQVPEGVAGLAAAAVVATLLPLTEAAAMRNCIAFSSPKPAPSSAVASALLSSPPLFYSKAQCGPMYFSA